MGLRFLSVIFFISQVFMVYAQSDSGALLGANLVQNSGFEKGGEPWKLAQNASVDHAAGYNSGSSLLVKNDDPEKKFSGTSQRLDIAPGSTIYFKAKVKGNLSSKSEKPKSDGARVYIQAYDEFGKVISGRYPKLSGLGTFDWKELSGDYTVPIDAAYVSIAVGLYNGVTGEAWFDDITIQTEKPPFIEAFLMKPHYRGMIQEKGEQVFSEHIIINRGYYENSKEDILVRYVLKNVVNKTIDKFEVKLPGSTTDTVVAFSPKTKLQEGDYTLVGEYKSNLSNSSFSRIHKVEVVRNWPMVYIDEEGYTVKNGERIFPFGLYIGHPDDEHLERIKQAGFNTVLSYGYGHNAKFEEYLDKAERYDLHVIYSLKDFYEGGALKLGNRKPLDVAKDYVNQIKYKPSLLAWYTVDELLPNWIPKIDELYQTITKIDPHHPTLQVHYYDGYRMLEKYYYNADIIATDPYPVGRPDLSLTSTRVKAGLQATHHTKGHWAVLQSMDWAVYQKEKKPNPPNLDELRNQCYQALIHGAKGILFYTYYDLFQERYPRKNTLDYDNFNKIWPDVVRMSTEVNALFPVLLNGKNQSVTIVENDKVEISCLTYQGDVFLLIANPFYTSKEIRIKMDEDWKIDTYSQGQITAQVNSDVLTLQLPSIGSGVFKLKSNKE